MTQSRKIGIVLLVLGLLGMLFFRSDLLYYLILPSAAALLIGGFLIYRWLPILFLLIAGVASYFFIHFDFQSAPMLFIIEGFLLILITVFAVLAKKTH